MGPAGHQSTALRRRNGIWSSSILQPATTSPAPYSTNSNWQSHSLPPSSNQPSLSQLCVKCLPTGQMVVVLDKQSTGASSTHSTDLQRARSADGNTGSSIPH